MYDILYLQYVASIFDHTLIRLTRAQVQQCVEGNPTTCVTGGEGRKERTGVRYLSQIHHGSADAVADAVPVAAAEYEPEPELHLLLSTPFHRVATMK